MQASTIKLKCLLESAAIYSFKDCDKCCATDLQMEGSNLIKGQHSLVTHAFLNYSKLARNT